MRGTATRRHLLAAAGAAVAFGAAWPAHARAARPLVYKLATGQDPSHPVNQRAQLAADRIHAATAGALLIRVFPANQLGSDTDLLSQVRNGSIEFFNQASSVLSTLVPAAGIVNTGFAFTDYTQVWSAMDGALGNHVRAQIGKLGLMAMSRPWDNGFRQVTTATRPIRTPADLLGLKLRVPSAPMLSTLFAALGASPTPINFNEVYSALQTRLVDGQENPLAIIRTARLYEVQTYCSLTNHVWDAYWMLGNRRAMERLPADMRTIVLREFERAAFEERADIAALNTSLRASLQAKGLQIIDVDKAAFKAALSKTSFYRDWRARFGAEAWGLLQQTTGPLG